MRLAGAIDLDACLLGGQAFRWRRESTDEGRPVTYRGIASGRDVSIHLLPRGGVEICGTPAPRRAFWANYLAMDDAHASALAALVHDPVLSPLLDTYPGLRILRQDPWESMVAFVTSANNNVARITGLVNALATEAGPSIRGSGTSHAFPSPRAVARVGIPRLRALGFGYRAPFIDGLARALAHGAPSLDDLAESPYSDLRETLLDLPGVGPKVADCIALFGFGHGEAFPIDRWVVRAVHTHIPEAGNLPAHRLAEFARTRWGTHAGLAQQFLFHATRLASRA